MKDKNTMKKRIRAAEEVKSLSENGYSFWEKQDIIQAYDCFNNLHRKYDTMDHRVKISGKAIYIYYKCMERLNLIDFSKAYAYCRKAAKRKEEAAVLENTAMEACDHGITYYRHRKDDLALKDFEASIEKVPCREALYYLGLLTLRTDTERGIEYLLKASEQNHPDAILELVRFYTRNEQYKEVLTRCTEYLPELKAIYYCSENLSEAYDYSLEYIEHVKTIITDIQTLEQDAQEALHKADTAQIRQDTAHIRRKTEQIAESLTALNKRISENTASINEQIRETNVQIVNVLENVRWEEKNSLQGMENTLRLLIEQYHEQTQTSNRQILEALERAVLEPENADEKMLAVREWNQLDRRMGVLYEEGWENISEEGKRGLLTGLMLCRKGYLNAAAEGTIGYNFNFLCIPVLTSLENEIKEKFKKRYIQYCTDVLGPLETAQSAWPKELIFFSQRKKRFIENDKCMLGQFIREYSRSPMFLQFLKDVYGMEAKEMAAFAQKLDQVNQSFRIPSAHMQVSQESARECFYTVVGCIDPFEESLKDVPLMKTIISCRRKI